MKKPLINWLDRSIKSGVVSHGGAVYRGRFSDFPFRDPDGQFVVQLYSNSLVLDYQKGWPVIKDAELDASFDSKGVNINIQLARLFSSAITDTNISIADFREPVVDVSGKVKGGVADVVKFVVNSPLNVSNDLLDIRYKGKAKTNIALHIPLKKGAGVAYSGRVSFDKGGMELLTDAVNIKNIQGDLAFSNDGFNSDNLTAEIFNKTSAINLFSQKINGKIKTYLATGGESDAALLLKSFSIPAYKHAKGNVNWQALLDFSDVKKKVPVLNVKSDLSGVNLDLPAPFRKAVTAKTDFDLKAYFKGKGTSELYIQYGNAASIATRLIKKKQSLAIERGHISFANTQANLPKQKVLHVSGSLREFYPGRWAEHIAAYGELHKKDTLNIPVSLNMSSLEVEIDEQKGGKDAAIRPTDFPVLHGVIKNFGFDGMSLGELSIDAIHHKGGMKLNKLNIHSPDMNFNSSGRWNYAKNKSNSRIKVSLQSNNLGKLFKRLGLAAIINNGKSDVKGSLNWSGTPFDFSLARLNGNLNIYLKDGSIADVEPGAGRVVGLLSLSELPRRLMLDFSDMFKKGLVFDEIKGNVSLEGGNAYSKEIYVESAGADVTLEGRTGLVKRDYDQLVTVIPKVGETLPVASGVLFGSQIGALVLLFEKLMGKEIEKAAARKYKVTGSWEKPLIERIDKPAPPETEAAAEDEYEDNDEE
jgi:uncharacterized protein YhdP